MSRLEAEFPDGWALSTSAAALRDVLPLCPLSVRVCVWRRQHRGGRSRRPLSAWEPLLVVGGRELQTARPQDVLDHLDYRGRYDAFPGALIGMKPPEFAVWMFGLLGAGPGDELVDVFPGSGAIGRAWQLYTSRVDAGRLPHDLTGGRNASLVAADVGQDASSIEASCVTAAERDAFRVGAAREAAHELEAAASKRVGLSVALPADSGEEFIAARRLGGLR